ncbi:MAG: AAA family ATPase [Cyanobacteriota bacterium]|nr:AAA family ATPase [Cyanobacteriota bacterium]
MEAVIFMGVQASGKSTFCREQFFDTHIRINLDMLKTRHRERLLVRACLEAKQPFVVDNTNPLPEDRQRYIEPAKQSNFRIVGYYFQSSLEECQRRNQMRLSKQIVPTVALISTYKKLIFPKFQEGFDRLYTVKIAPQNRFNVEKWHHEIQRT